MSNQICPYCKFPFENENEIYCGNDCEISALREIKDELLEALKEVLEELSFGGWEPSVKKTYAAIKKAKGE